MKFSITGLVALFNAFTAKPSVDSKRALSTAVGPSYSLTTTVLTSPPDDYWIVKEVVDSSLTTQITYFVDKKLNFTTRYTGVGTYILPASYQVFETPPLGSASKTSVITIVGTPLYINGPSTSLESVLTEVTCTGRATCTPSTSAFSYTCPIKDGTTQAVTTTMQYFSCTTGQKCTGTVVATTFNCGCGKPICTMNIPFIPIPVIPIPPGVPLPPGVPNEPGVPEGPAYTVPTLTSQEANTVTSPNPESRSGKISSQPLTSSSESSSSSSSFSKSSLSGSSISSSDSSKTTSSSSTSSSGASACMIVSSLANTDRYRTLSAWLNQFPFTLPATLTSANACMLVSSVAYSDSQRTLSAWMSQFSFTLSTSAMSSSSSMTTTRSVVTITSTVPSPSTTNDAASVSEESAASASKMSELSQSALMASVSSSVRASASRASVSLVSLWSAASVASISLASVSAAASIASVASAASVESVASAETERAKSTCVHYPSLVQSRPTMLPDKWAHLNDVGREKHRCLVDPAKVPSYDNGPGGWKMDPWNCDWEFQPFSIAAGWDPNQPDRDLVDIFCQKLVDNVVITYDGPQTGICQVYDQGKCIAEENGQCSHWEYYIQAPCSSVVVFSVTYRTGSPLCSPTQTNEPTDYKIMKFENCKKKLMDNLINPCSMKKKDVIGNLKVFPVIGGTFFDGCMQYTMVARKNPPEVVWGADNRTD